MNYLLKKSITSFHKALFLPYLSLLLKLLLLKPAENLDKMVQVLLQKWEFSKEESRKWLIIMESDSQGLNLGFTIKDL